ncbi:MAG: glycine zipper domain-containing protein [Chthoniobacter sp.]|nr:glycine zipper domain-containing protein [Chthoniobacter sp.]
MVKLTTTLGTLRRALHRLIEALRFVTPHYWQWRLHRVEVELGVQTILPTPYDAYELELRTRALRQTRAEDSASFDGESIQPTFEKLSAKALDRRLAAIGSVEIGAYAMEDVHGAFASIDHDVIAAVAQRAGHAIDSFSDLSQQLAPETILERLKAAFPFSQVDTTAPSLRPLIGSVGEQTVLRHFHEAGIDSHLAPHLNTAGWDLTMGLHQVNVKIWADLSNLAKHFNRYPAIPAVVPGDAAGIPADAVHFDPITGHGLQAAHDAVASGAHGTALVDDTLSGTAIHEHVQHAENLVTHGDSVFHGHLPYVTMALSGIREFDLLLQGKTDLTSAAKNAALDTAGTGVGGVVGAKTGAVVGTIFLPGLGTVVGGVVGGIFGAIKGREYTAEIKQRPFKEAFAAYQVALANFQEQAKKHEAEARAAFTAERQTIERLLAETSQQSKAEIQVAQEALDKWLVYNSIMQPDEARALLDCAVREIAEIKGGIDLRYRSIVWWKKFLWPDVSTVATQQALGILRPIQRRIRSLQRTARKGKPVNRGQVMALLAAVGVMQKQILDGLTTIYAAQRAREEQAQLLASEALTEILTARREAQEQLQQKFEVMKSTIQTALRPALGELNRQAERTRLEGAKLGHNV